MATFNLGSIPSLAGQLAAAKQIEAQDQQILASQIAAATQQERLRQLQDPQAQALERLQAQLGTQIQQATLDKAVRELDPAYQQQLFNREIEKAAALYGMRPQLSLIKNEVTGEVNVVDKRALTASPVMQRGGPAFSTGVKPTTTELVDEATGVKRRFVLNPDGSVGAPIGVSGLPTGNVIQDTVTGEVSVVNPQLPAGTAPGQAAPVTRFAPASSAAQPSTEGGGQQPFKVTPKPKVEKLPPEKIQSQFLGAKALFATAPRLEKKIAELRAAGITEPSSFEKTIINQAYQDPNGLISGFATALATGAIRPEIAELEQLRGEIESNYTTSKAGLSQTASEVKRTIPVAPTRFDSWDRMLSKTKNLQEISKIHVDNVRKQYPTFDKDQASDIQTTFATEADIPQDLPKGTPITVGGRPAIWE